MRNISGFAVAAALILAGIAGWTASTTKVDAAVTGARIDPIALTTSAGLPGEHYTDYSLVF